ncbi:copper ion binding protein [Desulfohalotomaculum tongense]|uniref:copper ion binding protein n=1 Tax=Desulforadius tongensis TaxID=1216062 RepID=UPI00195D4E6F|nr:copper ion binding protein [Desulforadius tongensis]MBM7855304.1 copper ion binding protein [Desulforadius tongensis]
MAVTEEKINVQGMSCGHCTAAVEKALTALPGVEKAVADLEEKNVTVTYDPGQTSRDDIVKAIEEEGYEVV